jgi:hypothetical protein
MTAVDEVRKILIAGNKEVVVSENVMPGIGVLQVEQVIHHSGSLSSGSSIRPRMRNVS